MRWVHHITASTSVICRQRIAGGVVLVALAAAASPARAQDASEPGLYGALRAGVQLGADLRLPKDKIGGEPAWPRTIEGNAGFVGEGGLGYDFGGFRLEATIGYNESDMRAKQLSDTRYLGGGQSKSFDAGLSGYVDVLPGARFSPFVGAGLGVSRVQANVIRYQRPTGSPPTIEGPTRSIHVEDWGLKWHLDAGVAYALSTRTKIELAGRYMQTSSLDLTDIRGSVGGTATKQTYAPRASAISVMAGLRQRF